MRTSSVPSNGNRENFNIIWCNIVQLTFMRGNLLNIALSFSDIFHLLQTIIYVTLSSYKNVLCYIPKFLNLKLVTTD